MGHGFEPHQSQTFEGFALLIQVYLFSLEGQIDLNCLQYLTVENGRVILSPQGTVGVGFTSSLLFRSFVPQCETFAGNKLF